MLDLDRLILKESHEEGPDDLHADRRSRPDDLMAELLIVIAFQVHIEGLLTLCCDENQSEGIEHGHWDTGEVNPCRFVFCLLFLR